MSNSDFQEFISTFLNKINNIIEKKGGKRKNKFTYKKILKKHKGGGKDGELDLPVTLNDTDINDIIQLQKTIQSNPSLKQNTTINIISSKNLDDEDIVDEFTKHIKLILENINTKPKAAIDMTPEELQVFSLYLSYKNLASDTRLASSIVDNSLSTIKPLTSEDKVMIEDDSIQENLTLISNLYKNINGSNNLTDKIEESIYTIKENSDKGINTIDVLYKDGASSQEISSASTSSFLNLFGYLSFLFSLLSCFKNRLTDYNNNTLKTKNPIIYSIISLIYTTISFILFCIGKVFIFLLNTKIGRRIILVVFFILYMENNSVAVFIANTIVQLIGMVDKSLGASEYINVFMINTQKTLINNIHNLLNNESVKALLSTSIASALMNPTVLANFINSLTPELSSQIIQQSIPIISESLKDTISNATPEMIQTITQGISQQIGPQIIGATSNLASELAPSLIEGISTTVTSNVQSIVTNAATTAITEAGKNMAQQQIKGSIIKGVSDVALMYGVKIVSYYLTGDTNAITNSGGKRTIKNIKNIKNKNYTKYYTKKIKNKKKYNSKKVIKIFKNY
jgi:hypothetical protein